MSTDWLVSTKFQATSSDGTRTAVTARFAAPVQRDGNWWCRHELLGLESMPGASAEIAGDDSLQALTLGIGFVGRVLESYVAAGGTLEYEDGDAFRIEMHFPPFTWP
jgi:hypothetical protein